MTVSSRTNEPTAPSALVRLLPVGLLWIVTLLLFHETAQTIVGLWLKSDTYTHAFLVLPIVLWLVWRRRADLAAVEMRPQPLLLLVLAGACGAWLLSEMATVGVVAHFALATMLVAAVPAALGWQVTRRLLFPLAFLYFAVPFGDAIVPLLMSWTADFTVFALRLTGIPVYREGLQFVIPSGTWSVVEACSGVRYLIASFMVGTLFAYLNYQSLTKRVVFIAAALLVPVLANWLRAYMIVMIGHLSNNELAAGVDHLIYGWLFFGLVIGAMFFVGARWSDPDPAPEPAPASAASPQDARRVWLMTAAVLVLLLGTRGVHTGLLRAGDVPVPPIALPTAGVGGAWARSSDQGLPWTPGYPQANVTAQGTYADGDRQVAVWIGYFRQQGPERKLVSSVNGLIVSGDRSWAQTARGVRAESEPLPAVRTGDLRLGNSLDSANSVRVRVWHLYWIGGRWTTSDVRAKLWQAVDRLLGRGDDGAVVILATPAGDDADATLEKFSRAHLGGIDAALAATRDTR